MERILHFFAPSRRTPRAQSVPVLTPLKEEDEEEEAEALARSVGNGAKRARSPALPEGIL